MAKVWITGARGLIGSYLLQEAHKYVPLWEIQPITREVIDLTNFPQLRELFQRDQPDYIIHCAGLTKSTDCESNPELAHKLNVEVTQVLCELAERFGRTKIVFFSTDLVFDGTKGNYSENDAPNPLSVYGQTKAIAEKIVLNNPKNLVIRTSLNAGVSPTGDRSFTEQLKKAIMSGQTLYLFVDEFRCPIHASVTAKATWELIIRDAQGIMHIAGNERLSRWEIGVLLAKRWAHLNPKIQMASTREYKGPPRPHDTSLKCERAQTLLSFKLPGFSEWLLTHPEAEL
jgi:dTDP-4-dehydrorhamnose reductase